MEWAANGGCGTRPCSGAELPGLGRRVPGQAVLQAHGVVQLLQLGRQRNGQLSQIEREGLEGVLQFGEGRSRKKGNRVESQVDI